MTSTVEKYINYLRKTLHRRLTDLGRTLEARLPVLQFSPAGVYSKVSPIMLNGTYYRCLYRVEVYELLFCIEHAIVTFLKVQKVTN